MTRLSLSIAGGFSFCALLVTALLLAAIHTHAAEVRLTSGAAALEGAFPESSAAASGSLLGASALSAGYPARSLGSLQATVISVAEALVARAAAAFKSTTPEFEIAFTNYPTNGLTKTAFLNTGGFDFAVSTAGPTVADYQAMPTLVHYPLQGNGVVPVYNLPAAASNSQRLALTGAVLCRIFRGNITMWNDPAIIATNPGMPLNGAAGNHPIVVMLFSASATHLAFSTYCNKIDPEFAAMIRPSTLPTYPATLNSKMHKDIEFMNGGVADTPYSLAMSTLSNAATIALPVAAMVNREGRNLLPTYNAMALTLYELATNGYPAGTTSYDLTNPQTLQAWPIMTMSYVYLDKSRTLTTCSNKRRMLQFLLFFYQSNVVRNIAESLSMSAFPGVLVSQLGLIESLQAEMTCLDSPLVSASEQKSHVSVNAIIEPAMTLFASFYSGIDPAVRFMPAQLLEKLAIQRVAMGENSLAVVNTAYLTPADEALMIEGRMKLIPGYMAGLNIIFTLPTAITELAANTELVAELGLPPLYPLVLNMEVCTLLFIGEIPSWIDSRLVAINPQLPAWFQATNAPTSIHILVGATHPTTSLRGVKLLFEHMRRTPVAAQYPWAFIPMTATSGPAANPFLRVVNHNITATRANFSMVDLESRLPIKSLATPGSVSYRPSTRNAVITEEWQFVRGSHYALGEDRGVIPSNYDSLQRCGSRLSNPPDMDSWSSEEYQQHVDHLMLVSTQRGWVDTNNPEPGCSPLSTLMSFAVKLSYSTAASPSACFTGLHALEFVHYLQSTDILSPPAQDFGVARLGEMPLIDRLSSQILRQATCDGESMLIVLPVYYSVPSSITGFGQAVAAIGLLAVAVSLAVVFHYRHKVVIRSSSAPFLGVILFGMSLLLGAMVAWAVPPTKASCSTFLWLANLGYMLLFCPLFAKTWRVWRIFSGSHLKIVKISNQKLLAATGLIVLLDAVFVGVWQGVAPLQPIEYDRLISGEQHYFTHCSVTSSGSGSVFVILAGVEKAGLLLFGAIMAFSTRNVKGTFNESAAISWTIYNTLMTLILGLAIIVFVKAVETTLVLLVLLVIMWLVFSAWGLLFVPKFHLLFQSDAELIEASRSEIAQEKSNGFSFASIALMTTGQVKQYLIALRLQLNKAERQLNMPQTIFAVTGALLSGGTATKGNVSSCTPGVSVGKGANRSHGSGDVHSYVSDLAPAPKDPLIDRERDLLVRSGSPVNGPARRAFAASPTPGAQISRPQSVSHARPAAVTLNLPGTPVPPLHAQDSMSLLSNSSRPSKPSLQRHTSISQEGAEATPAVPARVPVLVTSGVSSSPPSPPDAAADKEVAAAMAGMLSPKDAGERSGRVSPAPGSTANSSSSPLFSAHAVHSTAAKPSSRAVQAISKLMAETQEHDSKSE